MRKTTIRKYIEENVQELVAVILEEPFLIRTLEPNVPYTRFEDDSMKGTVTVSFTRDGDGWIEVLAEMDPKEHKFTFRFRMPIFGGGESPRVRNALLILAEAIRLDNQEHPQHRK